MYYYRYDFYFFLIGKPYYFHKRYGLNLRSKKLRKSSTKINVNNMSRFEEYKVKGLYVISPLFVSKVNQLVEHLVW